MSLINRKKNTSDFDDVCYDLLNFGLSPIEMKYQGLDSSFPHIIIVPPKHMATIPDQHYIGRTLDGKENNQCVKLFGKQRPLRKILEGVLFFDDCVYEIPKEWIAAHELRN